MVDELEEEAADPEIPEMGQSASNLSLLSARQAQNRTHRGILSNENILPFSRSDDRTSRDGRFYEAHILLWAFTVTVKILLSLFFCF